MSSNEVLKAVIRPWGNSQGIRIPKEVMNYVGLSVDDELEIEIQKEAILLKKVNLRKSLREYAAPYDGLGPYTEFDWGEGLGFERFLDE